MRQLQLFIFLLICVAVSYVAQPPVHLPNGKPVMIDGRLEKDEWADATVVDFPGLARLYGKKSTEYVWLAIEFTGAETGALDLYLAPGDGGIYDLHASAKLGERKLIGGKWPDWTWWNNTGWVANVSRVESFEKPSFLPANVREYQIQRSRFPAKEWKVRFEFLTPAEPDWKTTPYPPGTTNTDPKGWLVLQLD